MKRYTLFQTYYKQYIFLSMLFIFLFSSPLSFASFSLGGSTITQTGIDTDLSGLSAIGGVSTTTRGAGTSKYTIYDLNNLQIVIQGTLSHNPEQEQLFFNNPANPIINIQNGGTYNFGTDVTINSITRQSEGLGVFVASVDAGCCGLNNSVVAIQNGGNWNWKGATIDVGQLPWFADVSSNVDIVNGVLLVRRDATSDVVQIRQSSDNFSVDGFKFIGNGLGDLTFLRAPLSFENYSPETTGGSIAFSSSTPNYDVVFRGYGGGDQGNTKDIKLWAGARPILINAKAGSELIVANHKDDGNATGYGVALVYQELTLHIEDENGAGIEGAKYFIKDYDNGNREIYNKESYVVDNTSDNTYIQTTDSNGDTPTQQVLLAANVANNGNIDAPNTGNYAWDYRGKNNDNTDIFDIYLWSYLHNETSFTSELKGVSEKVLNWTLFPDTYITETSQAIVDAYTSIDTLDQLYDRAKSWKVQDVNIETPSITQKLISVNGDILDFGEYSLVIDKTAVTAFDVNTVSKIITIKSDVLSEGALFNAVATTGTISLVNGGLIDVIYSDANSDSAVLIDTTFPAQTVTLYSNLTDLNNSTNPITTLVSNAQNQVVYRYNANPGNFVYIKTDLGPSISRGSMKKYELLTTTYNTLNLSAGGDFTYVNLQLRQIKGAGFESSVHGLKASFNSGALTLTQTDKDSIADITKTKIEEASGTLQKIYDLLNDIIARIVSVKNDTTQIN